MSYKEFNSNLCKADVNLDNIAIMFDSSYFKNYNKGDVLFMGGDKADFVFIVISGWIKLFRDTYDGQESVIGLATTNDVLGESNIVHKNHMYSAEVINKTRLLKIPIKKIQELFLLNNKFSAYFVSALEGFVNKLEIEMEHISTMKAAQRISCFLLRLCNKQNQGRISLELPFEKRIIASYLGMTQETLSRGLKELKTKNVYIKGNKICIKEIKSLVDFSCAFCGLSLQRCKN